MQWLTVNQPAGWWPLAAARWGGEAERNLKVFWSAVFSSQTLLKWHLPPVPLERRGHWRALSWDGILTCTLSLFFRCILRLSFPRSFFSLVGRSEIRVIFPGNRGNPVENGQLFHFCNLLVSIIEPFKHHWILAGVETQALKEMKASELWHTYRPLMCTLFFLASSTSL